MIKITESAINDVIPDTVAIFQANFRNVLGKIDLVVVLSAIVAVVLLESQFLSWLFEEFDGFYLGPQDDLKARDGITIA